MFCNDIPDMAPVGYSAHWVGYRESRGTRQTWNQWAFLLSHSVLPDYCSTFPKGERQPGGAPHPRIPLPGAGSGQWQSTYCIQKLDLAIVSFEWSFRSRKWCMITVMSSLIDYWLQSSALSRDGAGYNSSMRWWIMPRPSFSKATYAYCCWR